MMEDTKAPSQGAGARESVEQELFRTLLYTTNFIEGLVHMPGDLSPYAKEQVEKWAKENRETLEWARAQRAALLPEVPAPSERAIFEAGLMAGNAIGADPGAVMDTGAIENAWAEYKREGAQGQAQQEGGPTCSKCGHPMEEYPASTFGRWFCDHCFGQGKGGDRG